MSIIHDKGILYIPKIAHGALNEPRSFGYLALTQNEITFVPQQTFEMKKIGVLTNIYETTHMNVSSFNDVSFWKVLPEAFPVLDSQKLEELIRSMASEIEGSSVIPLSDIKKAKVGLINLTLETQSGKEKINIGL